MNPHLFGPLPPDCYGSTDPPKIVIRQVGTSSMTIFDIANRQAVEVEGCSVGVLKCFDPETSLYLMEPGKSVTEPHFEGLRIPTLTTVSPLLARYKEFCKNGGVKLYIPVFALPVVAFYWEIFAGGRVRAGGADEGVLSKADREALSPVWRHFSSCTALVCVLPDKVPFGSEGGYGFVRCTRTAGVWKH
jgi:hypothetical protein